MKKVMLLIIAIVVFTGCKNNEDIADASLLGNWKLIEVLNDPGDGSGTFVSVNSQKIVTFNEDGTVVSNGSLCGGTVSNDPTSGMYSVVDFTYTTNDCELPDTLFSFEITQNTLLIYLPCIEPCIEKYIKQ